MKLNRLTERVWVYPYEEDRDRPNLSYIRGDRWSLAVDAGHSSEHTREFYHNLEEAGLPLPKMTMLTHWHWDHTFGMHAVHGLTLANKLTNQYLADFRERLEKEGTAFFFAMDERIFREYEDGKPVIIRALKKSVLKHELTFSCGNSDLGLVAKKQPSLSRPDHRIISSLIP